MMQIYRTAGLTDDPAEICEAISDAINHTKRPARGNLTPVELLRLSPEQRRSVNLLWEDRNLLVAGTLKPLMVGDSVRVLLLNRKEQKDSKQKGFAPKWSKEVYTVLEEAGDPEKLGRVSLLYWIAYVLLPSRALEDSTCSRYCDFTRRIFEELFTRRGETDGLGLGVRKPHSVGRCPGLVQVGASQMEFQNEYNQPKTLENI